MCTALTFNTRDHYFGRNLDLEYSYHESVTITPKNFPFSFRGAGKLERHYAIIGMAFVSNNYPLYYDATNERGLSMAGLNFPKNADYKPWADGLINVSPFEFIPWILCDCASVAEARAKISKMNLWSENFTPELPLSPLHWIIADRECAIVVESVKEGIKVYDNPVGVLTNNPPFDFHMLNLANYMNLTREEPENRFTERMEITPYSRGMGAMGLPGDLSSASRFVRAAFVRLNSECGEGEEESVNQFFHILGSVEQQRGCARVGKKFEITIYSSCCNTDKGIYYYKTYENSAINAVRLHSENLEGTELVSYPLLTKQYVNFQN